MTLTSFVHSKKNIPYRSYDVTIDEALKLLQSELFKYELSEDKINFLLEEAKGLPSIRTLSPVFLAVSLVLHDSHVGLSSHEILSTSQSNQLCETNDLTSDHCQLELLIYLDMIESLTRG